MKSSWLWSLPERNMRKGKISYSCAPQQVENSKSRLILPSLYFSILYQHLSISSCVVQKIFPIPHISEHRAILICLMRIKALFSVLYRVSWIFAIQHFLVYCLCSQSGLCHSLHLTKQIKRNFLCLTKEIGKYLNIQLEQKKSNGKNAFRNTSLFHFFLYCKLALSNQSKDVWKKSMMFTTGRSTWSNDYKIIVYSFLPVMILL